MSNRLLMTAAAIGGDDASVGAPIDPSSLRTLPEVYARLLRLRQMGWGDEPIARSLGVEIEALPMLERIAAAKLEVARRGQRD